MFVFFTIPLGSVRIVRHIVSGIFKPLCHNVCCLSKIADHRIKRDVLFKHCLPVRLFRNILNHTLFINIFYLFSLNECYFAGKGTALMLGSNERLQRGEVRSLGHIYNELSASQTSICSSSSDIQQHLQSMFYLLRPEETLKMVRKKKFSPLAFDLRPSLNINQHLSRNSFFCFFSFQAVKLESLRTGRTRYLVVVARPIGKQSHQMAALTQIGDSPSHHPAAVAAQQVILNPTSYFNDSTSIGGSGGGVLRSNLKKSTCDNHSLDNDNTSQRHTNMDDNQCETESNVGSSCSRSSTNEMEESCLLGIDCNEKTTVGLVLRVLADTSIRLDGDG